MEKIKVYLKYPWKFPDSPYYKYLVDSPPKGIEYLNVAKQKGVITDKKKFLISNRLKSIIRTTFGILHLPIPNAHFIRSKEKFDLIHCAHCLSLNKKEPWVADIELERFLFVSGKKTFFGKKIIKKILKQQNCKKLMAWTETTKRELIQEFPEIKDKVEVIYPAVPLQKFKKIKNRKIVLLFIGRYFYLKGGLHVLEVFDRITKKYNNVECIFVSQNPKEIYEKYSKNKSIKFFDLMAYDKIIKEIYPKADIFVYPGYSDSFGFAFLEAMSFGIPSVTINGYARNEIIENGKTGFVIEPAGKINYYNFGEVEEAIVKGLFEKTSLLIENSALLDKMSKNCINMIKNGKFSIAERNKKLEKIYRECFRF